MPAEPRLTAPDGEGDPLPWEPPRVYCMHFVCTLAWASPAPFVFTWEIRPSPSLTSDLHARSASSGFQGSPPLPHRLFFLQGQPAGL